MENITEKLKCVGYEDAACIDSATVVVEKFKNCQLEIKRLKSKPYYIVRLYANVCGVRDWAIDAQEAILKMKFAEVQVVPQKACFKDGDGARTIVDFVTTISCADETEVGIQKLVESYSAIRAKLSTCGILECRIKRERTIEYIPTADEIKSVLSDLPNAIGNEANRFNMFDILGVARMEIRHSRVLAWLLDSKAEHGLGAEIIKSLLKSVGEDDLAGSVDLNSFDVKREWNHIDIMLKSSKEKMIIAIENKIGADEGIDDKGESQLARYEKAISETFKDWKLDKSGRCILIFLTPDGVLPSEGNEDWQIVTYTDLLKSIEEIFEKHSKEMPKDVANLIRNYTNTIKRRVLMKIDAKLQAECRKFYSENRKVLDFIYDYGKMGLSGDVDEVLSAMALDKKIAREDCSAIEFTHPALDEYLSIKTEGKTIRGYRCFVEGAEPGSQHVCVIMAMKMTEDEKLNDMLLKFREKFTGAEWEKNKKGEYKAVVNLPWYGKNNKTGKKNWHDFSLESEGESLIDAVTSAVGDFLEVGVPKVVDACGVVCKA